MNYDRYVSKGGHVLWLQKRWYADDTRLVSIDVPPDECLYFRTLKRVMRGRTAEYQVLKLDGSNRERVQDGRRRHELVPRTARPGEGVGDSRLLAHPVVEGR